VLNVPLLGKLEGEFLPEEDKGRLLCFVFAPEGSTTEYTDRQVRKMEAMLRDVPEVQAYGAVIAFALSGPGQANTGIVFVLLKDAKQRTRNVRDIVNGPGGLRFKFFNEVEGAIAVPNIPKAIGRGFGAPFQLVIQAQDLDALNGYVNELLAKLRASGYLVNVRSSFEVTKPELRLDVDRNRAAALGVSIEDVSRTLQILFGGLDLSRVKLDGKQYQVITQLQRSSRLTPQDLDRLYVRNRDGKLIQLSSIVRREAGSSPNAVEHFNRLRSATISGSLAGVPLGTAIERVEALVKQDLPPGFLYDWTGESKEFKDAWKEFLVVLVLALIITYMVLAAQFESFLHPLTVLLSIPLAGAGALGLLWLVDFLGKTHVIKEIPAMNINLFSLIGFVLLVGLVTKNAILLVEFANQETEKGTDPRDAIVRAGTVRLRPILMTALATIAGIIPIAIGFGAGAESRRPMGVCVIGGMLSSTFLTLFIVPMVYTAFSAVAGKLRPTTAPASSVPAPAVTSAGS
jgi:multidrug efflux pump subunit AcrB